MKSQIALAINRRLRGVQYRMMMRPAELYDRDFFEWTQCSAALLRAGRFDQADVEHIAEETEDMKQDPEVRRQWKRFHLISTSLERDQKGVAGLTNSVVAAGPSRSKGALGERNGH
jgi:hypothetical protein